MALSGSRFHDEMSTKRLSARGELLTGSDSIDMQRFSRLADLCLCVYLLLRGPWLHLKLVALPVDAMALANCRYGSYLAPPTP